MALSSPKSHCVTPQITLLATITRGAKVRAFPENPRVSLRPLYDPLLTPLELHCFSVCPQIWFGLHFVLHAPKTFPNVFNRVSDSHISFCSNTSYSASLFDILFKLSTPFLPSLIYFSLTYFTFYLCTLSSSKTLSSMRVNWVFLFTATPQYLKQHLEQNGSVNT